MIYLQFFLFLGKTIRKDNSNEATEAKHILGRSYKDILKLSSSTTIWKFSSTAATCMFYMNA